MQEGELSYRRPEPRRRALRAQIAGLLLSPVCLFLLGGASFMGGYAAWNGAHSKDRMAGEMLRVLENRKVYGSQQAESAAAQVKEYIIKALREFQELQSETDPEWRELKTLTGNYIKWILKQLEK